MTASDKGVNRSVVPGRILAALCGPDVTPWRLGLTFRAFGFVAVVLSVIGLIRIGGGGWECNQLPIYGALAYGTLFVLRPRWGFHLFAAITVFASAIFVPPHYYPPEIFIPPMPIPAARALALVPLFPWVSGCESAAAVVIVFTALQNSLRGGVALYGLGALRPPTGADLRRVRRLMGICLWLGAVAVIAVAMLQLVAPGLWAVGAGLPGGRTLAVWQKYFSFLVPELVVFLFLAALLMAWRGPWGFPAIYAALVFSTTVGRTIVPAGFLLQVCANRSFTAGLGPMDALAGVAAFNAAVALFVGLAHAMVIELTPRRRGR